MIDDSMKSEIIEEKQQKNNKWWSINNFDNKPEITLWEACYKLIQIFSEIDLEEDKASEWSMFKK